MDLVVRYTNSGVTIHDPDCRFAKESPRYTRVWELAEGKTRKELEDITSQLPANWCSYCLPKDG